MEASAGNDLKLQPPLWLSVIGHGGFQPASLIDLDTEWSGLPESSEITMPRLGDLPASHPGSLEEMTVDATLPQGIYLQTPLQVRFACLVLSVLLALHLLAFCVCRLDRGFALSYAAADREQWGMRLGAQLSLTIFGIFALGSLYIPNTSGLHIESTSFHQLLTILQLIAAVASAAAWRMGCACHAGWRRYLGLLIALGLTFGSVFVSRHLLGFLAPDGKERWTERAFFFFRSANLLNGVSPALPFLMLLGGLSVWVFGLFGKMTFMGSRVHSLPS